MATGSDDRFPDGIGERSIAARRWHRHASPLSLLLLGAIIAAAFTGALGGAPGPRREARSPAARIAVDMPRVIRNGEFFEARIEVAANRPIGDLIIAVTPTLWRDMTINTMMPGGDETFEDGALRFSYGPLGVGDTLKVKIDGQVNPTRFGASTGSITALDGDAVLARLPVEIEVRP